MLYAYHKFITFGHAADLVQLGLLRLSQASDNAYEKNDPLNYCDGVLTHN